MGKIEKVSVALTPDLAAMMRQLVETGEYASDGEVMREALRDRLDPVDAAMIVDEGDHGLDWRSSSAIAKYALALRRISLAWREPRGSPAPAPSGDGLVFGERPQQGRGRC